jgi:uncharacterized cupredoxin-like copper-binding protein
MLSRGTSLAFGAMALSAIALSACGSSSKSSSTSTPASTPAPSASSTTSSTPSTSTSTTSSSSASAGGGSLALSAQESGGLSFDTKTLTAKAGKVTIVMDNGSGDSLPHGIAVEGNGVDKDGPTVQPGAKSTVTVTLKPGKYQFYCPVPGHKAAGMVGTLTVQ